MNTVEAKYKRGNKILFSKDDEFLNELTQTLNRSSKKAVVKWALEQAKRCCVAFVEDYPHDHRPMIAVEKSELWSQGLGSMKEAKQAILECHGVAKEISDQKNIALVHAIAQAASTVHAQSHAIGLPAYELSSIVFDVGINSYQKPVDRMIDEYKKRLQYWNDHIDEVKHPWAPFLLK